MEAITVTLTPEVQSATQEIENIFQGMEVYEVHSHDERGAAIEQCAAIKRKGAELEALRKTMTKPLDDSKKAIMDFFRRPQEILDNAEKLIKQALLAYDKEQAAIVERQRRQLQAEADALAEKERLRLEAEAIKAIEEGNDLKAAEMVLQSQEIEKTVIKITTPEKQKGASTRKIWKARVTDITKIPSRYLLPNMVMLNGLATAMKGESDIPGVEFYFEETFAVTK